MNLEGLKHSKDNKLPRDFEFDVIWTALQLHSCISVLWPFCGTCDFRSSFFEYRVQNKNPEITENLCFWNYNVQTHVDLFFNFYFTFLSDKTEINKKNNKSLNWINLEGSSDLKRQKYNTWVAVWLNHFEIDVIWTALKRFLKLHSHISVFWGSSWISVISELSFLGIGFKRKTRKSRKIFIFGSIMFKYMWLYFWISVSIFWVSKLK